MPASEGFAILADVSPRILIGKLGQTREDVLREHGITPDVPTIVILSVDMSKPKADGEE